MARPQKYDRQQVITSAQKLFWCNGYYATSITDLQGATSVKPGSLYQAFGNKDGLLKEVLAGYANHTLVYIERLKSSTTSVTELLETFFALQIDRACGEQVHGCLLVNSLLEFSGHDPALEDITKEHLARIQQAFEQVVEDGCKRGELAASTNSQEKAVAIMTAIWGIGVMGRMNPNKQHLQVFAETVLSSIERSQ